MVGVLKRTWPSTESRTGAVKTSPSGMFISPAQGMTGMPVDREPQVGFRPGDMDVLRGLHALDERVEAPGEPGIIEVADVEVEVLERLGAHAGLLGHAGVGQPEHAPLRLLDPAIEVDRLLVKGVVQIHLLAGNVGHLVDVRAPRSAI